MRVDFSQVGDVESFVSVPEGTYVCRIAEVREGQTRESLPRWSIRLEVADGEHAGRTAAWDGIVWSPRALPRTKMVLQELGFDVSGTLEIAASDLVGLKVRAQLIEEAREDPLTGRKLIRLRVPYTGYEALEQE